MRGRGIRVPAWVRLAGKLIAAAVRHPNTRQIVVVSEPSPAWLSEARSEVFWESEPLPDLRPLLPDLLEEAESEGEPEEPEGKANIPEPDSGPGEPSGLRTVPEEADHNGEPEEGPALTDEARARVLLSRLEEPERVLAGWYLDRAGPFSIGPRDFRKLNRKLSREFSSGKAAESNPVFAWIVIALIVVMFLALATGVIAGLAMSDPTPSQSSALQNVWSAFFSILGALVGVIVGKLT
jgi:hypothetical protein